MNVLRSDAYTDYHQSILVTYSKKGALMCMWTMCGFGFAWWIIAAVLLYFSWNKVVADILQVRPGKFWQALLVVLTLAVFCAPHHWEHSRCGSCKGWEGHQGAGHMWHMDKGEEAPKEAPEKAAPENK